MLLHKLLVEALRVIPNDKITAFEIDNNALVIYHEEIGLDTMWETFQQEVDKSKIKIININDVINDTDYQSRKTTYAQVSSDKSFINPQDSYLSGIDFNELFEKSKKEIERNTQEKINILMTTVGPNLSEETINEIHMAIYKDSEQKKYKDDISPLLMEKRPAEAKRKLRTMNKDKTNISISELLNELQLDPKGKDLYHIIGDKLPNVNKETATNDGMIAIYVNNRLINNFGPIDGCDNDQLLNRLNAIDDVMNNLKMELEKCFQ